MYKSVKLDENGYFTGAWVEGTDKAFVEKNGILVDKLPNEENEELCKAYKLVNNKWEIDNDKLNSLKQSIEEKLNIESIREQMEEIKQELSSLDYKTMKFIDGELTLEQYAETKLKKNDLRKQFNDLEKKLK
jgi:hypothetical protein